MSVINNMLRDLDQRQAAPAAAGSPVMPGVTGEPLRPVPPPSPWRVGPAARFLIGVILAGGALSAWLLQRQPGAVAAPVVPAPPPLPVATVAAAAPAASAAGIASADLPPTAAGPGMAVAAASLATAPVAERPADKAVVAAAKAVTPEPTNAPAAPSPALPAKPAAIQKAGEATAAATPAVALAPAPGQKAAAAPTPAPSQKAAAAPAPAPITPAADAPAARPAPQPKAPAVMLAQAPTAAAAPAPTAKATAAALAPAAIAAPSVVQGQATRSEPGSAVPARVLMPAIRGEGKVYNPRQAAAKQVADAATLIRQGRSDEARTLLQRTLESQPTELQARQMLVQLHLDAGQLDQAQALLVEGQRLHPDQPGLAHTLARLKVERGDVAGAIQLLEASRAAAGRDDPQTHALLGALLLRVARYEESVQHYLVALRTDPGNTSWLIGAGVGLEATGKTADATEAYRRAAAAPGLTPDLAGFLNDRLVRLGAARP